MRAAAVTAVGKLTGADAQARLVRALSDPNAGVRMDAAFWLGQPAFASAAAALGGTLAGDPDIDVRVAAAQALSRLGTAAARLQLRRGAKDADARVRRWAK